MAFEDLKRRFRKFSLDVAKLIERMPKNTINNAYCNQLIRSSSSSGANYYAACRAKSQADFINKMKIVEEEHGNQLLAITVKSIKTSRSNKS